MYLLAVSRIKKTHGLDVDQITLTMGSLSTVPDQVIRGLSVFVLCNLRDHINNRMQEKIGICQQSFTKIHRFWITVSATFCNPSPPPPPPTQQNAELKCNLKLMSSLMLPSSEPSSMNSSSYGQKAKLETLEDVSEILNFKS